MKLLELFLFEDRLSYAANTFRQKLEDAYREDLTAEYDELKAEEIVKRLAEYDPTPQNKYIVWIAKLYAEGKVEGEDLYKVKEDLELFSKVQQKLDKKDIMQYQTLPDLADALDEYRKDAEAIKSKKQLAKDARQELIDSRAADIAYEDSNIKVVKVNTREAACEFGKGSRWCTSATSAYNAFNSYHSTKDLYIILIKGSSQKYQIAISRKDRVITDIATESDRSISYWDLIRQHPDMSGFFQHLYSNDILKLKEL